MQKTVMLLGLLIANTFAGDFPQFMGPDRNGIVNADKAAVSEWVETGLSEVFRIKVGGGYGAPAVFGDKLYLLDYDLEKEEDVVRCLKASDGKEIWRYGYKAKLEKTQYDYSRAMPAVNEKYVVTIGTRCVVSCFDSLTGKLIWQKDLAKEYGTQVPKWFSGQNPFIDGDRLVLAVCGNKVLLAAFDISTGKAVLETPCDTNWGMTHNSVASMDFEGEKIYIGCSKNGAFGVSAKDGRFLFSHPGWTVKPANVPTPLVVGKDTIFFTGGYKAGSLFLKLKKDGDKIVVEEKKRLPEAGGFGSHVHTPILFENHIYGITKGALKCLDIEGNTVWEENLKLGLGGYIASGNMLIVLGETGKLRIVELSPKGFKELSAKEVFKSKMVWAPVVIGGGKLYLRSMNELVCLQAAR